MHVPEPAADDTKPASHGVHSEDPALDRVPAGQSTHSDEPAALVLPAGHAWQTIVEADDAMYPAGHGLQTVAPTDTWLFMPPSRFRALSVAYSPTGCPD